MKLTAGKMIRMLTASTIVPDFLTQPIFFQFHDYHHVQYWHPWRRRLWIALRRKYHLMMKERIVEVPFCLQAMTFPEPARILEFGCYGSSLAMELASLGHQVTGVDLRDYPLAHPNFTFHKGDFNKTTLPENSFDGALAISAVEHAGLGAYDENQFARGDKQILDGIRALLKPGGRLALTVPYGKPAVTPTYRVYDEQALHEALAGYDIQSERYFVAGPNRAYWMPATKEEIGNVDSSVAWINGLVCVIATKP